MLLDELLPVYDARERHTIVVRAPVQRVYEALWSADLASPLVRGLIGLRALPAVVLATVARPGEALSRRRVPPSGRITLEGVIERGFSVLAEDRPRELVLGVVGAFWRIRGGACPVDRRSFLAAQPPNTARAAWSFHVEPAGDGRSTLSTETRVHCSDAASRWRFKLYWILVRPGSGLIRRSILRSVRREAEG